MLKKSLALILVFLMSLTCVSGVVMADAVKAPAGPADVEGATYIVNETFTGRPYQVRDTGDYAFQWGAAGSVSYDETYGAIAHNGYVSVNMKEKNSEGTYVDKVISDGATYTFSTDILAPDANFGTENARYDFYLKNSSTSFKMATVQTVINQASGDPELKLYLAQLDSGVYLTAGSWYRITSTADLATGNVTSSVTDIATGSVLATKSQSGKITEFNVIQISANTTIANLMYSQNWRLYKEPVIVYPTAPEAPADVEGVTYVVNEAFSTRPYQVVTSGDYIYQWGSASTVTYESDYNAVKHNGYVSINMKSQNEDGTYSARVIEDGSVYVFSMDIMAPDANLASENARYDFYIQNGSTRYKMATVQTALNQASGDPELKLFLAQTDANAVLDANKWYRITSRIDLKTGNVTSSATDIEAGTLVAAKTQTGKVTAFDVINISANVTITNCMYSQNWRLYKEPVIEYPEAPQAPADVEGATYIIKNDFTAKPSGTQTLGGNTYTWQLAGNVAYDADYAALKHDGYVRANLGTEIKDAGKYGFSMDVLAVNPDFGEDRFDIYINGSYRASTLQQTGTGADSVVSLNLALTAMDKTLTMNTWYRISGTVDLATGNITVSAHDLSTGELVATKTRPSQVTSITRLAVQATKGYPNPIYSQNWRLYKLPNNFETNTSGTTITASYYLEEADDAIIAVALYQGSKMVDVAFVPYTSYKGEMKAEITKQDGCTAKAFLWKGGSLKPVFEDIDVK